MSMDPAVGHAWLPTPEETKALTLKKKQEASLAKQKKAQAVLDAKAVGFQGQRGWIPNQLKFPADLDDVHWMTFRAVEFGKKKRSQKPQRRTYASVNLPIPANLQLQYAADYEDTGLGIFGSLIANQMSGGEVQKGAMGAMGDMVEGVKDFGGSLAKTGDAGAKTESLKSSAIGLGGGIATLAAGASASALGTAIVGGDLIGGMVKGSFKKMGFVMNPHLATIFTGIGKKSHSFNFKFIAKSDDESGAIHDICKTFRQHMLPKYKYGKFGLTYPHEWEIQFSDAVAPFLYNIGNCVLKSFNVSYNGGGVPVFFSSTGAPVEIDISLGFSETFIETADHAGFGNAGINRRALSGTIPLDSGGAW